MNNTFKYSLSYSIQMMNIFIYILPYSIYVSVNLSNQAICKLSENLRQFEKFLFQSVNLFFYAFKTLKPGFFWYAVDTNLFRLGSTNPKKKSQTLDALWWNAKPSPNFFLLLFFFGGGLDPHQRASKLWDFFLGLVDPSWNRLVSTAYQKKPGFIVLGCRT